MSNAEIVVNIWEPAELRIGNLNNVASILNNKAHDSYISNLLDADKRVEGHLGYKGTYSYEYPKSGNSFQEAATKSLLGIQADFQRSSGHVSLSLLQGERVVAYLSFWPELGVKDSTLMRAKTVESIFMSSIENDMMFMSSLSDKSLLSPYERPDRKMLIEYGVGPSKQVGIQISNGIEVYKAVKSLKRYEGKRYSKFKKYNLYTRNCSNAVTEILHVAASHIKPSILSSIKGLHKRSEESFRLASAIMPLIAKEGYDSAVALIMEEGVSLPRSIASFIEVAGGKTPSSVLRYAEQLEKASLKSKESSKGFVKNIFGKKA